jgi:acyl-ACP thioesterase
MSIYERRFTVSGSDVDPQDRVRADAIAVMLQESGAHHADTWGLSIPELMGQGRTWVLARLAIEFSPSRPGWKDELRVTTWSAGLRGRIAGREYTVEELPAEPGLPAELVARASSVWFIIDLESRKPVRLDEYAGRDAPELDRRSGVSTESKLEIPQGDCMETPLAVRASDLDLNGHVNNTRYIEWLYESLPPQVLAAGRMARLDIHYLAETRYPETVTLRTWKGGGDADTYVHSVLRGDGTEAIRARTIWSPSEVRR